MVIQPTLKGEIGSSEMESDPFTLLSVVCQGNVLNIVVQYSGGCEKHTFQCIGSPMISKSLPPRRSIQLIHRSNNDQCKKLIQDTLHIDITAFAYLKEEGSEILLDLMDWKNSINYSYSKNN